jgi:hypothetical protein
MQNTGDTEAAGGKAAGLNKHYLSAGKVESWDAMKLITGGSLQELFYFEFGPLLFD